MTLEIRDAVRADLPAIQRIERASFTDPWTRAMFMDYLGTGPNHAFMVGVSGGEVIGYAIARAVGEESELLSIAVDAGARRAGAGARLLDAAMGRSRAAGALEMWLEVRASNESAQALYRSRGFSEMGVRKRYYDSPREDAILLRADLVGVGNKEMKPAEPGLGRAADELILSRASHIPRQEIQ